LFLLLDIEFFWRKIRKYLAISQVLKHLIFNVLYEVHTSTLEYTELHQSTSLTTEQKTRQNNKIPQTSSLWSEEYQ